ncbi:hypothetical protein BDA99DRAFT_99445 [Phascolomyces articulosus]|uniref:Uncharacterized protein n=1 Tax=Phascolomyces articulosus TaxID=60185 RepID=A0AAD5PCB0_9FUNG|nr:hypothetical protein BDA99DRAFT_99445 [Phascolomyces articulosus]
MTMCIILHNMIVKDERDSYEVQNDDESFDYKQRSFIVSQSFSHDNEATEHVIRSRRNDLRNNSVHFRLENDLVEHLWQKHRESSE